MTYLNIKVVHVVPTRCALKKLVRQFVNVAMDLQIMFLARVAPELIHVTRTIVPVPSPIHFVQELMTAPLVDATQTLITTF